MRTFYIMAAVAAVAVVIAIVAVLWSGTGDTPPGASRDTTAAVSGSVPDCGKLSGAEKERCLESHKPPSGRQ